MQSLIEFLGLGIVLPLFLAAVVTLVCGRLLPSICAARYAAALGCGLGIATGYFAVWAWSDAPPWDLVPSRHWQWLPLLCCLAMVLGPLGSADGVTRPERWFLNLLMAIIAAWMVVPTWTSLEPERARLVAAVAAEIFALAVLLRPLVSHLPPSRFVFLLAAVAASVALAVAAELSLRYGQAVGLSAAALGGAAAGLLILGQAATAQGVILLYSVAAAGTAFVGYVEPDPRLTWLLFFPFAPVALWLTVVGPIARWGKWARLAVQLGLVLLPIAITLAVVLMKTSGGESEYEGYY